MLIDEYKSQYAGGPSGNLAVLEAWVDEEWKGFLQQISWKFGQEDHTQLEQLLKQKVRRSKHYNHSISGKEGHIISLMCDLLDKRQSLPDPLERFIHTADLEVIFLRVGAGSQRLPDPSWRTWESLPKPSDTRNLADKVRAVCRAATMSDLGHWSRKASKSLNTQREFEEDVTLRSLKYQVFDACEDKLGELRRQNGEKELTPEELLDWIALLVRCCEQRLNECSTHYTYTLSGSAFLTEMVWELLDSCYLAFDSSAA
jgi:hypothetical protein